MRPNRMRPAQRNGRMTPPARTALMFMLGLAIVASALSLPAAGRAAESGRTPSKAVTITLYGSFAAPAGWGWATSNVTEPGPTLTVRQGDVVTFQLFAKDSVSHMLVIDLDNSQTQTTGDQNSTSFTSPTVATTFVFTASTAGTFNYFCGFHGYAPQHGTLTVQATGGTTPPPTDNTLLIVGGVVVLVVIVAAAAGMMM